MSHPPTIAATAPAHEPEAAASQPLQSRPKTPQSPQITPAPLIYGPLHTLNSTLRFLIGIAFVFTFIVQPFRIPSASMYPTLEVGDFLLVNKIVFAPAGFWSWLIPYHRPHDGNIVVSHFPEKPSEYLVKRVIGSPGDYLHLNNDLVIRDGHRISEPYAVYLPAVPDRFRDDFPAVTYNYPGADFHGWLRMDRYIHRGQLDVPSRRYFVLGDNRNDSRDSRYWGLVPRSNIVGQPLLIYFSLREPSVPDSPAMPDDKLNQKSGLFAGLLNFARWNRTFDIVH
jgi:signal peptidase I